MSKVGHLPSSGEALGAVADILSIRTVLAQGDTSDSTIKRVFRGEFVKPESFAQVSDRATEAFLSLYVSDPVDPEMRTAATGLLRSWMMRWDLRNQRVHVTSDSTAVPSHSYIPFLRLLALDIGVRLGALAWLGSIPLPDEGVSRWFSGDSLGMSIRAMREQCGWTGSQADLAHATRVTENAFSAWMTGAAIPRDENLQDLVLALSPESAPSSPMLRSLRRVAACARARRMLIEVTDEERAHDLLRGMFATAGWIRDSMTSHLGPVPAFETSLVAWAVAFESEDTHRCGPLLGEVVRRHLRPLSLWGLDLLTVRGEWTFRLKMWSDMLEAAPRLRKYTDVTETLRFFPETTNENEEREQIEALLKQMPPAKVQENLGLVLFSAGLFGLAAERLRRSIKLDPSRAEVHYNLAITLVRILPKAEDRYHEALMECQIALGLNPTYVEAAREIGVIQIDLRLLAEAEVSLLHAKAMDRSSASTEYHLAGACAGLGRNDSAAEHLREAVRLNPTYADAWVNLYAILWEMGDKQAAEKVIAEAGRHGVVCGPDLVR